MNIKNDLIVKCLTYCKYAPGKLVTIYSLIGSSISFSVDRTLSIILYKRNLCSIIFDSLFFA